MAFSGRAGGRFQVRRLLNGDTGAPGAGFIRISRPGAKPEDADPPDEPAIMGAAGRGSVLGDIVVITYAEANMAGEFSCAYELTAVDPMRVWTLAGDFIDGNLVVAGSVFSNVGLGAGISNSALLNILSWDDAADTVPELNPGQDFAGAYMGFVVNPMSMDTPQNPTQEILLVGDQADHLFWNGQTLTLSGVTIEDPTILVTTPEPPGTDAWDSAVTYMEGEIVSYQGNIYVALTTTTGMIPLDHPDVWQAQETITPSVTVSSVQPTTGIHGDLWYDSSIARLFLFYAFNPAMTSSYSDNADPPVPSIEVGTWADVTKN